MDLDLYSLRIFLQVLTDQSFSEAARSLRITQPTVSQQIAKLEGLLGGRLFERIGHSIIPTPLAQDFSVLAGNLVEQVSDFEGRLHDSRALPRGLVKYAMPESCQWTPHYRAMMKKISELSSLRFDISIGTNDEILQGLREARYDFGFIVGERVFPELRFQRFADESYLAVAVERKLFSALEDRTEKEELRLITYPGWETFLAAWAKGHGVSAKVKSLMKEPVVHVGTLAGAIHAAQSGAGIAIVPAQCVQSDLDEKRLVAWKGPKNASPSHPIYLARRTGEKPSKRVQTVIDLFLEAKANHS